MFLNYKTLIPVRGLPLIERVTETNHQLPEMPCTEQLLIDHMTIKTFRTDSYNKDLRKVSSVNLIVALHNLVSLTTTIIMGVIYSLYARNYSTLKTSVSA